MNDNSSTLTFAAIAIFLLTSGCAAPRDAPGGGASPISAAPAPDGANAGESAVRSKLARVGLETQTDEEAQLPAAERGQYLPCRVAPGARDAPLPEHPAGYLIVEALGEDAGESSRASSAAASGVGRILEALDRWRPGSTVKLRVRRNPYLSSSSEWWEQDVTIYLPR